MIQCDEAQRRIVFTQHVGGKEFNRTYQFDKVFSPETTQERLYAQAVAPMVDEVLQGFNCTVFAYGQTGTGKTYTMTGEIPETKGGKLEVREMAGVIPRAIQDIFSYLDGLGDSSEYTVKCCFLELYNEEITDLLALGNDPPKVRIMEDRSGVVLQGLEEPHVKSADEIFGLLENGNAKRRTAETLLNKQSSRSHSVFVVTVSVREVLAEGEEVIRVGKLYLVDLAGSENVSRSGAVDQRAKEAGNINKSLLTLGRVITALVEGQVHVPYRDSKLTRLLRDSLGGRTKTCIIATIAPTVHCQEETMSTLDYAHRAKNIKNKPEVNQRISKTTHLKEMASEIAKLKAELVATREKNGVYIPVTQYEEDCEKLKQQAERLEVLEAEAEAAQQRQEEEKAALVQEWEGRVSEVKQYAESLRSELEITKSELAAAKEDIAERDFIIGEQNCCELALAQHATHLTSQLGSAVADIGTLFARVDFKNSLEEQNVAVLSNMSHKATCSINALREGLTAAAAKHVQLLSAAQNNLTNLTKLNEDMVQSSKASLEEAKCKSEELLESVHASLANLSTGGVESIDRIMELQQNHQKQEMQAAQDAKVAIETALKTLKEIELKQGTAIEEMSLGHNESAAQMKEAMQTFTQAVVSKLESVTEECTHMRSHVETITMHQKTSLQNLSKEFSDTLKAGESNLMENIQTLVNKLISDAQNQILAAATEMCSGADDAQGTLKSCLNAMDDSVVSCRESIKKQEQSIQLRHDSILEQNIANVEDLKSILKDQCNTTSKVVQASHDYQENAITGLTDLQERIAAAVKNDRNVLESTCKTATEECTKSIQNVQKLTQDLQVAFDEYQEEHRGTTDKQSSFTQECQKAIQNHSKKQAKELQQVSSFVHETIEKDLLHDTERDNVPTERIRQAPNIQSIDALRAPSISVLAKRFRSGQVNDDKTMAIENKEDSRREQIGTDGCNGDGQEHDDCLKTADTHDDSSSQEDEGDAALAQENTVPNHVEEAEEQDDENEEPKAAIRRKRTRSPKGQKEQSPSKLRAAFEQGERRRTRRTTAK